MQSSHSLFIYALIGLGAAIGGMGRYWCNGAAARFLGDTFPWGAYTVNVLGSFVIGLFAALTGPEGRLLAPVSTRLFVTVGLCGGFTTFSTFSLETLNLLRDGQFGKASFNVAATVISCLLGVWLGWLLATAINER